MHTIFNSTKLVLFDVAGVILEKGNIVKDGLYPFYKNRFDYDYVKSLYNDVRSNMDGDISLWKGLGEEDVKNSRERFLKSLAVDMDFFKLRDLLISKNINIGVLSNMPKEWAEYQMKEIGIDERFNPIVFSGLVGLSKPNLDIYEYTLSKISVDPSEVIFIDDKLKNLKTANLAGMKTLLFNRGEFPYDFIPDLEVKSFRELLD